MDKTLSSRVFQFADLIQIRPGRIASRTLSIPAAAAGSSEPPEWVLYAMAQDETISTETSPRTKVIQVLEGELHMTVDGQPCQLQTGASIIVLPDTWHEFAAPIPCKFLQISL